MAEDHGLAHGHHEGHKEEHKDKDRALYWGLGLGAAGLVVAVLLFMNGGDSSGKKQGTNTVVQPSTPFMPNPTDVSIGSMAAPLFWPALPTSGTPHHPKVHHKGGEDESKKTHTSGHHTNKSNDRKGYGTSPNGASHGHTVTHHAYNPVIETKGHQHG